MAENNNGNKSGQDALQNSNADRSVGNRQGTTQTGAQNAGGTNAKEDDQYTDDLRQSGDRAGSNRKTED